MPGQVHHRLAAGDERQGPAVLRVVLGDVGQHRAGLARLAGKAGGQDVRLVAELRRLLVHQLDKGFGMAQYPEICSAVSRARIILSAHVRKSVANCYVELQEKLNNSEITIDVAKEYIHELRQHSLYPEEVSESNLSEVEETLTMHSLADYDRGIEAVKREHQQTAAENKHLRVENEHIHSVNEEYRSQIDALTGDKEQLQQALFEGRKKLYNNEITAYKKSRSTYIKHKLCVARWCLIIYTLVTILSVVVPSTIYVLKQFKLSIPLWCTILVSFVFMQLLARIISLIPAADLKAAWSLLYQKQYKPQIAAFQKTRPRPSYNQVFNKLSI